VQQAWQADEVEEGVRQQALRDSMLALLLLLRFVGVALLFMFSLLYGGRGLARRHSSRPKVGQKVSGLLAPSLISHNKNLQFARLSIYIPSTLPFLF
jgi:hypothetical protein